MSLLAFVAQLAATCTTQLQSFDSSCSSVALDTLLHLSRYVAKQVGYKWTKRAACHLHLLRLCAGGDAVATQKWLDTAGGQRSKPQNVWTQQKHDKPSQWASGNLTERERAVKNAWAKQSQQ